MSRAVFGLFVVLDPSQLVLSAFQAAAKPNRAIHSHIPGPNQTQLYIAIYRAKPNPAIHSHIPGPNQTQLNIAIYRAKPNPAIHSHIPGPNQTQLYTLHRHIPDQTKPSYTVFLSYRDSSALELLIP